MRILMVSARYLPFMGGIEAHIQEVGTRMAAMGHQVKVLTTDPKGDLPPFEVRENGLRVYRVKAYPANRDFYFSPAVYQFVRDEPNCDIVHFQGWNTFVAPIGMLAAARRHIPFVLTFHSGGHSSRLRNAIRGVQRAIITPLAARADCLLGCSEFEANFFSKNMGLDPRRFVVVPNGASLPAPSDPPPETDPHLILSVGRLEYYKGHHRAILAMPEVLRRVPQARLMIVGSGPYEAELRKLVATQGLQAKISFTSIPITERQRYTDLLCSAGLVVLLSEYEAHPVAVMEALSLRRNVLVAHTSGLAELAQRGLCESVSLLNSSEIIGEIMARELTRDYQRPAVHLSDWDDCTKQLLGIYANILNRKALPLGRQPSQAA